MSEELDLIDLLYTFWKKRYIIIGAVIVGMLLSLLYTAILVDPKYTSSVTLVLAKNSSSTEYTTDAMGAITQSDIALNQKLISTYSEIMKSRRVAGQVIKNMDLKLSYEGLRKCISVSSVKDTDVIKLSIITKNPELSAQIADEMTKVFIEEVAKIYNMKNISVIDSAEINNTPVNINYAKNMIIFVFVCVALVCAVIFLIYYFDNTIKTEENVTKVTNLPVLCTIPNLKASKGGNKHGKR